MYVRVVLSLALMLTGIAFGLAYTVRAHFSGASWEYPQNGYVMDIGFDAEPFVANRFVRFDFALKDEATLEERPFAETWVRIVEDPNKTMLATGVHTQSLGPTTVLFVFPRPGSYTFHASFRDSAGKDLATTSFPILVEPEPRLEIPPYVWFVGGMTLGILGLWSAQKLSTV